MRLYIYYTYYIKYVIHIISNIHISCAEEATEMAAKYLQKKMFLNKPLTVKKTLTRKKQSPRGVLPEEGVLRMCCRFSGAYLCVGVVSTMLQSDFVEIC